MCLNLVIKESQSCFTMHPLTLHTQGGHTTHSISASLPPLQPPLPPTGLDEEDAAAMAAAAMRRVSDQIGDTSSSDQDNNNNSKQLAGDPQAWASDSSGARASRQSTEAKAGEWV